jgi:hypothetical protein
VRPRADEVLTNVVETFDEYVLPDVSDPYAKSMATVISGLLRQVNLRIELEGQALFDDVREARVVLAAVLDLLGSPPARDKVDGAADLATETRAVLGKVYRQDGEYPSLRSLADESAELTRVLDGCHRALLAAKSTLADDERYAEVRAQIRAFAAGQLQRETAWGFATLINPGL